MPGCPSVSTSRRHGKCNAQCAWVSAPLHEDVVEPVRSPLQLPLRELRREPAQQPAEPRLRGRGRQADTSPLAWGRGGGSAQPRLFLGPARDALRPQRRLRHVPHPAVPVRQALRLGERHARGRAGRAHAAERVGDRRGCLYRVIEARRVVEGHDVDAIEEARECRGEVGGNVLGRDCGQAARLAAFVRPDVAAPVGDRAAMQVSRSQVPAALARRQLPRRAERPPAVVVSRRPWRGRRLVAPPLASTPLASRGTSVPLLA